MLQSFLKNNIKKVLNYCHILTLAFWFYKYIQKNTQIMSARLDGFLQSEKPM